jgi:hypothetical protein
MDFLRFVKISFPFQNVFVRIAYDLSKMSDDVISSHNAVLFEAGIKVFLWVVSSWHDSVRFEKNPLHNYFRQDEASHK